MKFKVGNIYKLNWEQPYVPGAIRSSKDQEHLLVLCVEETIASPFNEFRGIVIFDNYSGGLKWKPGVLMSFPTQDPWKTVA